MLEQQAAQNVDPGNPLGSLLLLGILLFIVFRILQAINSQNHGAGSLPSSGGGRVFHMPERKPPPPPPAAISLTKLEASSSPIVSEIEASLLAEKTLHEENGMESVGDFTVDQMPGFSLRVYTSQEKNLVGILYKDPGDRVWLNLITEYADGRIITTSSAEKEAVSHDRPRGMPLYNFPGLPFEQMFRRHKLETRATRCADPVAPEKFPDFFASNYQKLRAHLDNRASASTAKDKAPIPLHHIEEVELDLPVDDFPPEPSDTQKREWLAAIYKAVPTPPADRAVFQERLVWVLEGAPMEAIADTIERYATVRFSAIEEGRWIVRTGDGEAEDIIDPGELTGGELFDKINAGLPEPFHFTQLPVKEQGVFFYSAPQI